MQEIVTRVIVKSIHFYMFDPSSTIIYKKMITSSAKSLTIIIKQYLRYCKVQTHFHAGMLYLSTPLLMALTNKEN